jgi:glucose/arabinose dehydrogenase
VGLRRRRGFGRPEWLLAGVIGALFVLGGAISIACKAELNCRGLVGLADEDTDPPPVVAQGAGVFERGFVEQSVASGLVEPTDFAFLPDGRVLISDRRGMIRMEAAGKVAKQSVLDLRSSTSPHGLLGIVTVQVDPDFPRRPYIYVLRALRPTGGQEAPTSARLSRYRLEGSVALPESEVVLLGSDGGGGSCLDLPPSADCLPADSEHIGSQIRFSEGDLYVSTGDGGGARGDGFDAISVRAQDVDSLGGKILRITRSGAGVPTNPYWNGDPRANRSKVWARGLRNPFRIVFRSSPRDLYVADLGNRQFDEISVASRAANLGWPCYEGTARFGPYDHSAECRALYARGAAGVRFPAIEFRQDEARTLIGGVFYSGTAYPARYRGSYFFADFTYGWMKRLRFGARGDAAGRPASFGTGLSGPVAIQQGPDGRLYYLSYVKGELRRIDYRR